jgi:hypothetical protein
MRKHANARTPVSSKQSTSRSDVSRPQRRGGRILEHHAGIVIVPTKHVSVDPHNFDPADNGPKKGPVQEQERDPPLGPGELVIHSDSPDSQGWFAAEVRRR